MNQTLQLEKKKLTIKKAVIKTFAIMPNSFSSLSLCINVRNLQNKMTMDGSILRILRSLREKGICNYEVTNHTKGIYTKKANLKYS